MRKSFLSGLCAISLLCGLNNPVFAGIDFDAADDIVNTNFATDLTSTMTFFFVFKADTFGEGNDAGRIFDKRASGAQVILSFLNNAVNTQRVRFDVNWSGTDGAWASPIGSIATGTWYTVAITYDGSSTTNVPIIYMDGAAVTVTTVTGPPTGTIDTNDDNYYIGNRTAADRTFDGIIKDFAIWNVILTAQEVAELTVKRAPLQMQPANLLAYYPMDDGPGESSADADTISDMSSNRNNATGDNGANNTGLTWKSESLLSYP